MRNVNDMLDNWLDLGAGSCFLKYYTNLMSVVDAFHHEDFYDDYFTPHDGSHCRAIENIIRKIISNCDKNIFNLSELEQFLLLISVWSHDLGMISNIAEGYFDERQQELDVSEKRLVHDLISAWYLSKHYKILFLNHDEIDDVDPLLDSELRGYVDAVNIIIKYHRKKTNIKNCPEYKIVGGETIRCRLLACLLRLGDTLHIDSSRFDERSYNILQLGEFDRFARLHWLKSYVVSAPPSLDKNNQVVTISIDLPEIPTINIIVINRKIDTISR